MDIKYDNAGQGSVTTTFTKKKHQEAVKYSVDKRQGKLFVSTKQGAASSTDTSYGSVRVINYGDASLEAEVYWLAKLASDNYSLLSSDNIGDLFRAMFPDSKIAANFSLSHISSSYIIGEGMSNILHKSTP